MKKSKAFSKTTSRRIFQRKVAEKSITKENQRYATAETKRETPEKGKINSHVNMQLKFECSNILYRIRQGKINDHQQGKKNLIHTGNCYLDVSTSYTTSLHKNKTNINA